MPPYTARVNPLKIYDYLTQARQRVFDAVRPLTPQQYRKRFVFGLNTIASTITHIMISEWYYIERLDGRTVPPYDHWTIKYESPPAFDHIENAWREQANRTRASIIANTAKPEGWDRRITWISFPDDTRGNKRFNIACTAGDLFTQLVLHEVHHRAQVMTMLRELGVPSPVQDIDFNAMMYERTEIA